jgi:hypothetical protein
MAKRRFTINFEVEAKIELDDKVTYEGVREWCLEKIAS